MSEATPQHEVTRLIQAAIARVLDAGATETGRPYFVMELVRGTPITHYCDDHDLSPPERLGLFMAICQAVQHAHQKGIIHRDLKPSNVLVTVADDRPIPKVIDFGVAKALHQKLTDKTLFTGLRQLIGTPAYMSPEQADIGAVDIDTRSDIYALGVMLYELLTGTTPFDPQTLRNATFDEMRRIIREVAPPKPSTRIGALMESGTKGHRHGGTKARRHEGKNEDDSRGHGLGALGGREGPELVNDELPVVAGNLAFSVLGRQVEKRLYLADFLHGHTRWR